MSHLQKLTIKGVRSFDPDSQQEITFFPLTLIHGPNGSGKTTIIEALKYATTGTLPDNCNSGRSFVHDVKFADKATIKGKVRLQYTDVDQRPTVVCRRMQTSFRQPRNGQPQTVTFTQLNSVIKRLDEGGGRHPHRYAIHNANNVNKNTPENAKAAAATTTTPSLSSPLTPSTPSPSPSLPSLPPPPSSSSSAAAATAAKANASTPTNANATNAPGDINNEVLASLGVNRALLNSVIFCHQEDTNWPLAEGKVLRERLNGVFGTDGYLERLEQIRQARDRETKAYYVLEREVQHVVLAKRKEAIKRKELSDEQARTDQEKRRVAELEAEAKTLQDRLDSLTVKEARVESASNAILEIRRSLEDMHNMARAIEGTCNPAILAKSNDQVNEELEHFDENALQMLARKRELEAKLEKLEAEHSRLVYDRQRISLERAKANECANTIFKLFADRNALIATSIKCNSPEFHSILAKCNSNNNNNNVGGASPSCALNNNHNNNNGGGVSLISNLNANKLNNAERNYVLLQFDAQLDQLSALANEKRSGMQIQEYKLMQELDSLKNLKSNASHEKAIWQIQLQKAEREQAQLERTMAAHHLHNHHNHLHNHHGHSHSPHSSQHNHGLLHSNPHHSPHHALHHVNVNIVHPPNVNNNNNNNSITSNNNNHLIVGGGLNSHSPSPMVSTPTSSPSNTSSPSLSAMTTLTPSSSSSSSMSSLPMGSLNSIFDGQIKSLAEKADAYRAQLANQFDAGAEEKLASAIAQLETQAAELRAGIEANRARLEATLATAKEKAEYDYYRRLRAEKVARLEAIRVQKLAHVFGAHALEQQQHQLHSAGTSSSSASASPSVSHSPLSNLNYSTIINSSSSISDTFYELLEKAASDQENYASRVSAYENELCSKRCKLESQQELLSRRIKELDANKSKFDGVCSIHTFEAFLKGKEIELHQLRDERAKHSGKAPVIEKQVETIRHCDHCPVCEKEISVASGGWTSKKTAQPVDKQSLIEGLRRSTAEGQQEVKRLEVQIAASERLVAKLGKLRSSYEAIQHVTREIILIKGELPSLREQVSLFQKTVEEERGHLRASRARVEALRRCTRDVVEYDSSLRELADLERKLASFDTSKWPAEDGGTGGGGGGSLTGSGGAGTPNSCAGGTPEHHPATSNSSPAPPKPPSAEQLNHHLQQLQHHLEQITARLGEVQKESLRFTKDKMLLQTLLQAVERSKSELEVQDQMAGMKRRNEIVAEVNEAKGKIVALEGRAATEFDPKIDRLEGQLRALAGELSSTEKDNHHAVFAIQEASKKLKTIFNEIDRYSYDLAQSQAITSPEQVEKLNREMEQFEETKKMFSQQLTEATQAIGNLELQKRELFDCKRYINLQKNLREGEDRLREEEARLGNTSLLEAKASCSSTYSQLAMLRSQIAVSQERLRAGEQRLAAMEAKLARGGGYAAADRRHREKLLEKTVTELAIEDLNRYYRALDHSVVAYHRSKMEEVNRLLVSFWQVAYQGGDIDHISIVASPSMAEEEAASSVPPSSSSTSTLTATTTTSSSSSFTPTSTNSATTTTTSSTDDTQLLSSSSSTMTTATSATPTTTSATSSSSSSLLASMTAPLGRRSFTYRVVMVKKGKVMNMRGRCSAGQKVLASFIIRLALAVIFARERFAVLTLDEPTTNLDKANIQAFSRAVISLIRSNRHFQIIIITHDSEFLQCLNAHTGEFYEVLKDYKGFSTIVRKSTSEVHLTGFPAIKIDRRRGPRKRKNLDGGIQEAGDVPLKWAPKRARLAPPPVVVPAAATPVQPQQQQQQQQQPQQQQGQQRPKPPVHKLLSSALHNNSSAIQPIQQLNGVGGSGGIQVLLPPPLPSSQLPASTQTPTATATSSSSSSSSASSSSSFPVTSLSSSTATTTSSTSSQL